MSDDDLMNEINASESCTLGAWRDVARIERRPPFDTLFAINPTVLAAIAEDIRQNGYDVSRPITVWRLPPGGLTPVVVVDGNTRLQAAIEAGLDRIAVIYRHFEDEAEALEYAIHHQRDRRNLTDSEILRCIEVVDELKARGRPKDELAQSCANLETKGKSSERTAEIVGVSPRQVEKVRAVLKDPVHRDDVLSGEKSISKAYTEIREEARPFTHPERSEEDIEKAREFGKRIDEHMKRVDDEMAWLRKQMGITDMNAKVCFPPNAREYWCTDCQWGFDVFIPLPAGAEVRSCPLCGGHNVEDRIEEWSPVYSPCFKCSKYIIGYKCKDYPDGIPDEVMKRYKPDCFTKVK